MFEVQLALIFQVNEFFFILNGDVLVLKAAFKNWKSYFCQFWIFFFD